MRIFTVKLSPGRAVLCSDLVSIEIDRLLIEFGKFDNRLPAAFDRLPIEIDRLPPPSSETRFFIFIFLIALHKKHMLFQKAVEGGPFQ